MEGRIRSKIISNLKSDGYIIIPLTLGQNWPDTIVLNMNAMNRSCAFIEFKSLGTKGKLSDGQELTIERLMNCGYETLVPDEDTSEYMIREFLQRNFT